MPSRQQKSAKKGSKRYLMFVPDHILVNLSGMADVPLVTEMPVGGLKQMQIINGSVKTKKLCVSSKMFEMEFKFSKLVKSIVFRSLRPTDWLPVQSTACALRK